MLSFSIWLQTVNHTKYFIEPEILLRYRDNGFENAAVSYKISRSFFTWRVIVCIRGEERNLTVDPAEASEDYDDLVTIFLSDVDCRISHTYKNGTNCISFSVEHVPERKTSWLRNPVLIAVILGAALSLGAKLLPGELAAVSVNVYTAPLNSALLDVLKSVTVFYTFTSLVCSLVAMENIRRLSTLCGKAVLRFLGVSAFIIALTSGVCFLFFTGSGSTGIAFEPGTLYAMLLDIIPANPVQAFLSRNMIQLIVLGFLFGIAILALGDKVKGIRAAVGECHAFMEYMMMLVSKMIPLMVFLSTYSTVITTELSAFGSIWGCIIPNLVAGSLICVFCLAELCIRFRQNLHSVLEKIYPISFLSFITGSSSVTMPKVYEMVKKEETGKNAVASYWVPLSFSMFSPSITFSLVVYAFFAAEQAGTAFSPLMLVILFIIVLEFGFATPKIPGGIMATTTLLLSQLGLPADSIGLIMAANVFVMNIDGAMGSLIRCTELLRAELLAEQL